MKCKSKMWEKVEYFDENLRYCNIDQNTEVKGGMKKSLIWEKGEYFDENLRNSNIYQDTEVEVKKKKSKIWEKVDNFDENLSLTGKELKFQEMIKMLMKFEKLSHLPRHARRSWKEKD